MKMLDIHTKRSQLHLINQIRMRNQETPNFSLFIGAGASYSSGVKTSKDMIQEWSQILFHQEKKDLNFEEWEKKQDWFDDEEKYSILFEKVYDRKPQRRNYIEQCIMDAKPSWGYIYLSNIISNNYFNVILTTNFDDLLNESTSSYSNFRPLVCAHDSAISDVRITSVRPKIVKLHGDFLYDSIKNTVRETEALEKNMREKFVQFAKEYGLIVIGYAGNDRSIMDILDMMVRSEENYFPHGLYWCIRNEEEVSKKVQRLLRRENTFWVKIEGFDEFMAELHTRLNLVLPKSISNPYESTTNWLNQFISLKKPLKNPIIIEDILKIKKQIERFESQITTTSQSKDFDPLVPYEFLGDTYKNDDMFKTAIIDYSKELRKDKDNIRVINKIAECYENLEEFDKALKYVDQLIKLKPDFNYFIRKSIILSYKNDLDSAVSLLMDLISAQNLMNKEEIIIRNTLSNNFLILGKLKDALQQAETALSINPMENAAIINKSIAIKRLDPDANIRPVLEKVIESTNVRYYKACAYAVLENKEKMLKELNVCIKDDYNDLIKAIHDPDYDNYRDDEDFKKLIQKWREKRR